MSADGTASMIGNDLLLSKEDNKLKTINSFLYDFATFFTRYLPGTETVSLLQTFDKFLRCEYGVSLRFYNTKHCYCFYLEKNSILSHKELSILGKRIVPAFLCLVLKSLGHASTLFHDKCITFEFHPLPLGSMKKKYIIVSNYNGNLRKFIDYFQEHSIKKGQCKKFIKIITKPKRTRSTT